MTIQEFNKLTKAEQRVLVAKDILEQFKADIYRPRSNHYIRSLEFKEPVLSKDSLKDRIYDIKYCIVCALGATLISAVKFKNNLTIEDARGVFVYNVKIRAVLKSLFSDKQLSLIENAFEGYQDPFSDYVRFSKSRLNSKEIKFCNEVSEIPRAERFRYIFENIIRNKGTFKIETL